MKVLILAPKERYDVYTPDTHASRTAELIFPDRSASPDQWLAAGGDAQALIVTPTTPVTEEFIAQMPNLKMIHSEGVGFDRIDVEAARKRGIYVCNNAGCNAASVSELAIMLMAMLLRRALWGDGMVRSGRQAEAVRALETQIPADLNVCTVGLIGFGAIAQATAKRLQAYGSKVYYYSRHQKSTEEEAEYGVEYLPLYDLAERCNIVSLHLPANKESTHMLDQAFFAHLKPGAFLVNTARGAIIDDEALSQAIRSGILAGAAVDAYEPEPVSADHPLVQLAAEFPDRLILSPHHGGIAQSAYRAVHRMLFEDLEKLMNGQRPDHVVNGL